MKIIEKEDFIEVKPEKNKILHYNDNFLVGICFPKAENVDEICKNIKEESLEDFLSTYNL